MKKYIILLFLVFMCFGCKATYNLTINNDLSVVEEVVGVENEDFYDRYPRSTKERVIGFVTTFVNDYLDANNYKRKIISGGNYTGEKVYVTFNNINDYFEKSEAYKQLYEKFEKSIDGNIVTINLKDKYPKNGNSVFRYIIDECTVKVTLPFAVKKHNADEVDKETNTYTWNLDIDDSKEIYLQFDTSKKFGNSNNKYLSILVLGSVFLVLFIIFLIYNKKTKVSNKI